MRWQHSIVMRLFCHVCSHNPEVLWAQRSDKVYLTVALPDAKDISVKCEPQGLFTFSALGALGKLFEFSLELYGKVVPEYRKNVTNWNLLHQSRLEQMLRQPDDESAFVDEDCESSDDDELLCKFQQP
ncbi:hypothetical protein HID58_049254 [Brassica napus]|uniref:Co-chaperone protein p23 n=2 Tax=Brassica TaxID=3705 RepID=A0ABQ8B4F8_BRANA|nr:hypothetical protein HID58_049254 [Brassica napus]